MSSNGGYSNVFKYELYLSIFTLNSSTLSLIETNNVLIRFLSTPTSANSVLVFTLSFNFIILALFFSISAEISLLYPSFFEFISFLCALISLSVSMKAFFKLVS